MSKKLIWIIVAAIVVVGVVVGVMIAVNSGDDKGNGGMNSGNEITDTSVEGDVVEGSSIVVTGLKEGSLGAKVSVTNAGDTMQNHIIVATFLDAAGKEIATGEAAATLEPGESKESIMAIDGDWENYATVEYKVGE
jgi:hypothetical protein